MTETAIEEDDYSIIHTSMAVEAMREVGFKSTTHAIAEIIDNGIEADATDIDVFGVSRWNPDVHRTQLSEIGVLDNGTGMDEIELRRALRYGDGTRRGRKGMGRFGVGLPNSSMSQAKKLTVYSWLNGPTNAMKTELFVDAVVDGQKQIPKPVHEKVPGEYLSAAQHEVGDTGTLVVWSDLDKVQWRRVSTTFRKLEYLVGRMYRRFLADGPDRPKSVGDQRRINLVPVEINEDGEVSVDPDDITHVRPNDPLYLMTGTSCPTGSGADPMFQEISMSPMAISVEHDGETYEVVVRVSYARPAARNSEADGANWPGKEKGKDAGATPWGQHAAGNIGVSIIRADREIDLDAGWTVGYDPRERWWGVEVDFPTALDEAFGVMNSKQGATVFSRLAKYDWRSEAEDDEMPKDVRERLAAENDPRGKLIELQEAILRSLSHCRDKVKESRRTRKRHDEPADEDKKADAKASNAIKERIQQGHQGESEKAAEGLGEDEQRQKQIYNLTTTHKLDPETAVARVTESMVNDARVRWIETRQDSPAFFSIEPLPNLLQVALNTAHPVHEQLYEIMHGEIDDLDEDDLRERLALAAAGFKLLMYSWARYEEEQSEKERRQLQFIRSEWGRYAHDFFDSEVEDAPPSDLV